MLMEYKKRFKDTKTIYNKSSFSYLPVICLKMFRYYLQLLSVLIKKTKLNKYLEAYYYERNSTFLF